MTTTPTMTYREWLLIGLLSILWGSSFFFVDIALMDIGPLQITWFRTVLAAVVLSLWALWWRIGPWPRTWTFALQMIALGAISNVLPYSLIAWGQLSIPSGLASVLNATTPIFGVLIAAFVTRLEPLNWSRGLGVAAAWIGVTLMVITRPAAAPTGDTGLSLAVLGVLAVLAASLAYAVAANYGRRFRELHPVVVAASMLWGSSLLLLPVAWPTGAQLQAMQWSTWLALSGLAMLGTACAYLIYFRVLNTAGPTNILLVTFLIPISACLLGITFLGETLSWGDIVGALAIFMGLLAVDGRIMQRLRGRRLEQADQ